MKAPTKQIKIVQDANKIIEKYGLNFFNDHTRNFSSNKVQTKFSENDMYFEISKIFKDQPEKLHHSYMKDLIKQIKFTLIFE